jgi:hypothetical protein
MEYNIMNKGKMKIIISVFKIILVIIAIPFMIVPGICIAGLILLDNIDASSVKIMKHANIMNKG